MTPRDRPDPGCRFLGCHPRCEGLPSGRRPRRGVGRQAGCRRGADWSNHLAPTSSSPGRPRDRSGRQLNAGWSEHGAARRSQNYAQWTTGRTDHAGQAGLGGHSPSGRGRRFAIALGRRADMSRSGGQGLPGRPTSRSDARFRNARLRRTGRLTGRLPGSRQAGQWRRRDLSDAGQSRRLDVHSRLGCRTEPTAPHPSAGRRRRDQQHPHHGRQCPGSSSSQRHRRNRHRPGRQPPGSSSSRSGCGHRHRRHRVGRSSHRGQIRTQPSSSPIA
jgi:hypothetical protein